MHQLYVVLRPVVRKVGDSGPIIERLETTDQVRKEVGDKLAGVFTVWADCERIDFSPSYSCDPDEVFRLESFAVPEILTKATTHRQQFPEFVKADADKRGLAIKAILVVNKPRGSDRVTYYYQQIDRRQVIDRSRYMGLLFLHDKYDAVKDHVLTIGDRLTAVLDPDSVLLFRSFRDASQLLDLSDFFKIATDKDIRSILSAAKIANTPEDIEKIIGVCDDQMRRKFSLIHFEGTLDSEKVSVQSIVNKAKGFELELKMKGQLPDFKLVVPTQKETLKRLLKFLSQDYYESILTGEPCVSNSHRKLKN